MAKDKLTNTAVEQAKPRDKACKIFDGGGLFIFINKKGAKYWRLKYRFGGKEKLLSLGVYPLVSLKEAREMRFEAKKQITLGIDPNDMKKAEKRAQHNMTSRAVIIAGEYMNACDTYLKLGLRAQAQCRATLETLSEIKNPKSVAFVKQANIAGGHQQVNNGVEKENSRAEKSVKPPNKLLEADHRERVDVRTKATPGRESSPMETVGAKQRPKDLRRER